MHFPLQLQHLLLQLYLQGFLYGIHCGLELGYFLLHFALPAYILFALVVVIVLDQRHHPLLDLLYPSQHLLFFAFFLLFL